MKTVNEYTLAEFITENKQFLKEHRLLRNVFPQLYDYSLEDSITIVAEIIAIIYSEEYGADIFDTCKNILTNSDKLNTLIYVMFIKPIHPPH